MKQLKIDIPKTLSDLKSDPRNPRIIDEISKAGLAHSMAEFGDISGLVYNIRSGHLVCGHQRKDLLPANAPLSDFEESRDDLGTVGYGFVVVKGRHWQVRFVDLPPVKEKAANVTANNAHIAGAFSADITDLLKEIELESPDLYDQTMMHKILDDVDIGERYSPAGEENPEYDLSPLPYENYNYVVLLFKNEIDWATAVDHFQIKKVKDPKNTKKIALGMVIDGAHYLNKTLQHLWKQKSKS